LEKISVFEGISKTFNISPTTTPNFSKLYIRVRKEIVATGVPLVEENTEDSHLDGGKSLFFFGVRWK
jgi:predicted sulfurtransferase